MAASEKRINRTTQAIATALDRVQASTEEGASALASILLHVLCHAKQHGDSEKVSDEMRRIATRLTHLADAAPESVVEVSNALADSIVRQ